MQIRICWRVQKTSDGRHSDLYLVVRAVGIEPTLLSEPDFESGASTSSTTPASGHLAMPRLVAYFQPSVEPSIRRLRRPSTDPRPHNPPQQPHCPEPGQRHRLTRQPRLQGRRECRCDLVRDQRDDPGFRQRRQRPAQGEGDVQRQRRPGPVRLYPERRRRRQPRASTPLAPTTSFPPPCTTPDRDVSS